MSDLPNLTLTMQRAANGYVLHVGDADYEDAPTETWVFHTWEELVNKAQRMIGNDNFGQVISLNNPSETA